MVEQLSEKFICLINQNLGIAYKVTGIYFHDADERADGLQEMMYQLWKAFPTFDGRARFSTWMYRVCLNTALTYKRKSATWKSEPLSPNHYQIADNPPGNQEELIALLRNAIAHLSELNKAIVLLYLEEMSYDEIALVTGLTRSNVSVRLVRIKRELEMHVKQQI
ncbi:sigma-70 family RNA polymerase sigma factor [Pedobacter sp. HMF7647]|uniref:Sigma-70 family RNA polymerase sigma factor n=2 Tax=Hufsiella arboris TaxID=2695275 RepID=A0A7K1YFL5_9SPHI|nr:sigma-70 family RNA polymerase sigma factor [Hufsiella arboris]